eukprot:NODE_2951_length_516_cov_167.179872_g2552_i0.p1 GENE.NODE_2951_length_516_cov_167.179872_g2552_i0~~NODE_2951_length_516_cov_167.179872_g2552_i0.p1  ORF type:complete len:137 (-),score=6.59 NODE_2951_length_516_cov_167.179872_g2552_i0:106-495(-)
MGAKCGLFTTPMLQLHDVHEFRAWTISSTAAGYGLDLCSIPNEINPSSRPPCSTRSFPPLARASQCISTFLLEYLEVVMPDDTICSHRHECLLICTSAKPGHYLVPSLGGSDPWSLHQVESKRAPIRTL